jgi:molybdopterin molybdotransferase
VPATVSAPAPLSPADAARLVQEVGVPFPTEDCPIASAHGRVLRQDVIADRPLPPFDRVTLDGYALRAGDVRAADTKTSAVQPAQLTVIGAPQAAGMIARTLPTTPGACIEVMTGAVLPRGADCVVPYEDTDRDGSTVTLAAHVAAGLQPGAAIHREGSDHGAGDRIVPAGTRLSGRELAVAAACGCTTLRVAALPRIALVSTGDELVEVGAPVAPHLVRRSNDLALRAALIHAGYPLVQRFHYRDVPQEIETGLHAVLAEFDVVIATGGVSKGRHDHLPATLAALGVAKVFHGVAQRPGKPMWFGVSRRRTPVFALPGNPVSCFVCLHRYVLPAFAHASGVTAAPETWVSLASPVEGLGRMTRFLPVRLHSQSDGRLIAAPEANNTSGDFAGLIGTDGFVELPPQSGGFPIGHVARFFPWA